MICGFFKRSYENDDGLAPREGEKYISEAAKKVASLMIIVYLE